MVPCFWADFMREPKEHQAPLVNTCLLVRSLCCDMNRCLLSSPKTAPVSFFFDLRKERQEGRQKHSISGGEVLEFPLPPKKRTRKTNPLPKEKKHQKPPQTKRADGRLLGPSVSSPSAFGPPARSEAPEDNSLRKASMDLKFPVPGDEFTRSSVVGEFLGCEICSPAKHC